MLRWLRRYTLLTTLLVVSFIVRARDVSDAPERAWLLGADTLMSVDPVAVTAVKHEANLQQSAVTATVLDLNAIERKGIGGVKDIVTSAPNFYMPDYGSRMTSSIYVRGLGTRIDQPVVGMTVDNVPIADKNLYDTTLPDIERIEVLRGAQSTLYGRNTMCGVVNIYTLSPLRYQGIRVRADYGSRNSYRVGASAYFKHSAGCGSSVSAQFNHTDGYHRNDYTGSLLERSNNADVRAKFQWRKNFLSIDNTLAFTYLRQNGYPYTYMGAVDSQKEQHSDLIGTICYNDPASYGRMGITEGLTARHDWERITLTSITAYQYLDDRMVMDQDFLPLSYFTLEQAKQQHDISEDIIIRSRTATKYQWLAGAFLFYKHQNMQAPVTFLSEGIENLILKNINQYSGYPGHYGWGKADGTMGDSLLLGSDFTTSTLGWALYHESSLKAGRWALTLGVRLDSEHISMRYHNFADSYYTAFPEDATKQPQQVHLLVDDKDVLRKNFMEVLPKFTATYSIDNNNTLYLSVSKGYKAGGFNTQMFSEVLQRRIKHIMGMYQQLDVEDIITYDPEKSWNAEVGSHFSTADARFRGDVALFWIECFDQQLTVFPEGQTTGRMMTNAGRTRSFGVEASLSYNPVKGLTLSAAYGYTNARFREFKDGVNDYAGNAIPYAPENTLSVQAVYDIDIASRWLKQISLTVGGYGAGRIYWNESNTLSQPFYATLDGSVRFAGEQWAVDVWVKNATNTRYNLFYFESMGNAFLQRARGAMTGVRVTLEFN
ncbi:MAG: TonB-dependent receptor [Alistipes sp.]|nr:TonB-dependent receptor [Alistipes sp.]